MSRIDIYTDDDGRGVWIAPEGYDILIDMSREPDGVGLAELRNWAITWGPETCPDDCHPMSAADGLTMVATYRFDLDYLVMRLSRDSVGEGFARWMGEPYA